MQDSQQKGPAKTIFFKDIDGTMRSLFVANQEGGKLPDGKKALV
jgi:hypothetical protein